MSAPSNASSKLIKLTYAGSFILRRNDTGVVVMFGAIKIEQEARLSQRDRTMLRVIEYFAKSMKVIRNDTVA